MRDALSDILDVNADLISDDFITKNMPLIEQAAKGSGEAIDQLRSKMDEEIILQITAGQSDAFIEAVKNAGITVQEFADRYSDIDVGMTLKD